MPNLEQREKALKRRLAYLENRLENIEDQLDDPKSNDWSEQAVEQEGDEVLEELGLSGLEEIKAIKAALDRVEAGSYGICVTCNEEILPERLDTIPHTPFCRNCARKI